MALDISAIRMEFPILDKKLNGKPLVYLDSAATAQKPVAMLEAMQRFYENDNANIHRGMHFLTEQATIQYENARRTIQKFINAAHPEEIIFTKSCTESINLVASCPLSHGERVRERGSIILSILEHHSNIVSWMQRGAKIHWIDIDASGCLQLDQLDTYLKNGNVELVAITGQSNVLGTRPPLKTIIQKAHASGAKVLIDAAQLIAHHPLDVQELDCDFLAFSGHKLYGPTGIGVLYGKRKLLESMPPFLGGGMMIKEVSLTGFTPADLPQKFEGGTPPIAEVIGLKAAIEWIQQFDWKDIEEHEQTLMDHAIHTLSKIEGIHILCHTERSRSATQNSSLDGVHPEHGRRARDDTTKSGCLSFTLEGVHPHDLTDILGQQGICLRAGHHCTMPLHKRLGVPASTRVSFGIYNTTEEIDLLSNAIRKAQDILK